MGSSSVLAVSHPSLHLASNNLVLFAKPSIPLKSFQIKSSKIPTLSFSSSSLPSSCLSVLHKSLPLAASALILLSSYPAKAGFLSGFSGIESVPGPELPQIDFLNRLNENQKKYAENDARFRESPLLKKLLERSKLNLEKNRQEVQDKYCIRGAEWGVGDCSAEGMSPEEKENFISMLKQKAGVKE
ncbi:uncharacterized protein LOC21387748 isoform X2 [Morus notabilis]|uniref:uncharacterized protein LOC21387748 isoform X2 n=1 Tax=Morus notabilis TaxID=981085 RepID=UPI000CED2554|nr:uncharacterized protein LOC21387748 isoform X2 [Morus notabilis]